MREQVHPRVGFVLKLLLAVHQGDLPEGHPYGFICYLADTGFDEPIRVRRSGDLIVVG